MGEIEILREREADFKFEAFDKFRVGCDHEYGIEEVFEAWDFMRFGGHVCFELILDCPR